MDFEKVIPVSGQTYTRKIDYLVLSQLSAIAQSTAKMAGDIRLFPIFKRLKSLLNLSKLVPVRCHTRGIQCVLNVFALLQGML